jgi:4-nitrophenyl phosphatase
MIEAATGVTPTVIGKPKPAMFEAALRLVKAPADRTLMIGDRLGTDVSGAQAVGMKTALVLTGVTTRDELNGSALRPDGVFENLPDLIRAWSRETS